MTRWLRFNAVGLLGVAVQMAVLEGALRLGLDYLPATALAVEAALLHNYVWHRRWTWRDRPQASLLRFQLTVGVCSVAGNLLLMRLLVGGAHLNPVLANLLAITICSLANYLAADRTVFLAPSRDRLL
jgi:putative flippase GtrA